MMSDADVFLAKTRCPLISQTLMISFFELVKKPKCCIRLPETPSCHLTSREMQSGGFPDLQTIARAAAGLLWRRHG